MNAPLNSQFSRRAILKAGALTIGFAMTARSGALAQNAPHSRRRQRGAHARVRCGRRLLRDECRRIGNALLRESGSRAGPADRDPADGGRGARHRHRQDQLRGRRHRCYARPGTDRGLDRHPARWRAGAAGRGDRAEGPDRNGGREAQSAGRRTHDGRRHGAAENRRRGGQLRRAPRRQELRSQARSQGPAEGSQGLHHRRQAAAAPGRAGEVDRHAHLYAGLLAARHAAWPRCPSGFDRRFARVGR